MRNQDYMIHSVKFTCVLDTNVIFPIEIRDILFWFAHYGLYTPKWSTQVFAEWEGVMRRKGISEEEIVKRTNKARLAFPDALVHNYESLIVCLELPDMKDRHILAAAIRCNAHVIVTNNISDFPSDILNLHGLTAIIADDFLADLIDLNEEIAIKAFRKLVSNRTNPDMDEYAVLDAMRRNGLVQTADFLQTLL
jgi:hypothetical protein